MKLSGLLLLIPLLAMSNCQKSHKVVQQPIDHNDSSSKDTLTVADCKKCIVLTDQADPAIDIVDVARNGEILWSWSANQSNIDADKVKWFSNPDDVKPVYDKKYILINASGGGVALIRISDKKAIFYAYAGKNPHSSELLPDGNIVTASSTDNRLVIFHVDTSKSPGQIYKKIIPLSFAHNVVWDKKRKILWSASKNHLYTFRYNFDCTKPDLIPKDTFQLPGDDAHDLFPVYGKDSLWLTNTMGVYTIALQTMSVSLKRFKYLKNIKSVSSGPMNKGFPTIIMKPTESWWSDQIMDSDGNVIYKNPGMKVYKARWFLENTFSYPNLAKPEPNR